MPRIPFTDLASSPEFKAMPPEDQQVVATGYWDDVAAERPDQAEFYKGIRDVSKSLLDAKTKRADASPVQRRFLDAQVQDLAFDLSLGDEFAQGRLTQEGYTEALKVRNTESAQRQAPLDKTRDLFSDDPAKQKALAIRLDGLEQTATTGGIFGSKPFIPRTMDLLMGQSNEGLVSSSRDAYAALKEQTAKDYGMEPDEVEDLVKHRLGFQEKPVSRDAVGNPFIKPEIMAQGPDAVKQAILNSDLPWREKQRMTAEGDLKERMDGYYKSTMEGVKKNHPELAKLTGLDKIDDPRNGFELLMSDLNKTGYEKAASGFTAYTFGVAEQIAPALAVDGVQIRAQAKLEGRDPEQAVEEARNKARGPMTFARRAEESVNQLSREFYKNQGTLWGVDASAYGSGAGSVLTAVGLGMATGGLALPVTSARVATMGPTALRMLNGANSVMKASPSIGLAMAQTGTSTYENALKSGKSEEEAGKLATLAGATEGVITGLFSLVGVGGLESVGEQLIGTAARQAVRDTAKSGFRTFGEKMLKGVTAEQFEEGMIAAFDAATVQARINPNMTVEDFGNTLRETALVTLAVSGPTIGMGALKETLTEKATYQQTDDEIKLRADLNLADATDPLRDRVRREGGVGTPLGERRRLTRPGARGTVPLEGTIPSDVVTDVNGVPVIPDDATNRIDTTAAQPSQANIPPAGQGPATTPAAPAAPAAPAPARTYAPLPPQERRQLFKEAEDIIEARDPIAQIEIKERFERLKRRHDEARRELEAATTPGDKRRAELDMMDDENAIRSLVGLPEVETSAPITEEDQRKEAARQKAVLDGLDAKIARGEPLTDEDRKAWVMEGRKKEDLPTPTPVNRAPKDQSEQELYDDWVTTGPYGGPEMVTVYRVAPVGADPTIRAGTWVSANTDYLEDYAGADWRSQPHEILEVPAAHLRDAETGGGPGDTLIYTPPIPTPTTDETKVEEASGLPPVEGQPVVPSPAVQAEEGTAQREGQGPQEVAEEAPAEGAPAEAEPDYAEVFEVLNDRDPDTKPINTESSKFRELVNSLKDTRVGELVGRLFQKKADVAELEKRIKKERKERDDQRKERNQFRIQLGLLDVHQEKIKELTKGGKYPDGIGHGNSNAIKQWLVERGLDPKITNNKTWRKVALRESDANSKAKTERIQAQFDKLTPEAKEVVEAFHKMGKKPAEEKESLEIFFASKAGQAIRAYGGLKSRKYFTDRGLPIPNEYDGLDNRVPPHIATAVFKNSETAGLPDQVAGTMDMDASEFWIEFWAAVNGQTDRVDQTQEDYDERKFREAEDREIAFAEQQIKALENKVQTVDLRQVRDGDKFTLGGTEYTATGVEADKRGQTESFTLRGDGPLEGTTVSDDFFAESVTPTKGSLAHVDPAEIEAINIAQAFPEEFEDAAEPAPTATEPEVAPTAGPVPYSPEALKETFDVSDEQAVAMDALVQAMGLDTSRIQLQRGGFQTGPDILYQETSSTKWDREKFDSLPDQSKKNLAINIVEYGWNPAEFGMTDADVQTWAAEGLAKRAARLAEETAAEARSRAVLEKSKTAPPEASLVTEADLQESQLPDDGYFYHVTTPTGARAILKSRRIASGKRQSMADGYYAEYSRGKVFFTDRGGVSYWQGKISDHLEAQGRSGKTVTIRIPKHAVGDLKVDEPGTSDARTPAWFSPENVLFQNQQGPAKGSFEQLPETGDILLRGLSSPDVSTGVHEIAHAARRTILNRDTPAEARAGITDADIAVVEEWAGAKDGVWSRAAEEKFARGWERYLRDGKSPVAALQGVFDKMAAWLRSVYVTVAGSPIDVEISPEMRAVFDKLVSRTLPQPQAAAPAPQAATPAPQPQATTPPPPAEPTPPRARPVQPGMAEVVSTQNAATDAWREANGFPPIFKNNPVTFTQYWQDAQKLLKQDPDAGKKLVARMKKELFQPDTSQVMLILNEMLMAKGAMERALYERNLQGESATADQIAAVNDALAYYAEMTLLNSRVGSIQATAFGARKVFVTDELDIGVIAGRIQHAQGGKELSKEQSAELQAAYAKIKEFEDREKVREAEAAEDNAQQVFENMVVSEFKKDLREGQKQGEKPLTTLQRKAQESREWLRQNIGGRANMNFLPAQEAYHVAVIGVSYIVDGASAIGPFVTRLIKDFGNRYTRFAGDIFAKSQELHQAAVPKAKKIKPRQEILDGIDPGEMVNGKAIYQLVRHYVNEGLQTFEEVMTAVHADLQLSHPNLTMREVHDAFSNYGIVTQPSQEKDAKTTRKYREMARYSSQLEDAMAKDYPKKTGPQRDPQAQEVRDLAKQVRDTIRKFNLRPENGKEQLKSTFDAIKTRLKNEFEDYDTAVKKGEERKAREPQKFTAEEEAELKDLRQKRDDRKKDYEAIFKKKGLTDEQRIERMEALLDRRIEEERKMLEEGILKRDREMQMGPWTPALRKQQETLNKLKADRRDRQKAARPKTPELEKKYRRDLKSLDKRIKEEEDLLAAGLTARQKNFKMGRWTPEMAEMQARLDALRDDRRELAKKQAPKKSEEQTAYERSVRAIEAAIQRYNDIINAIKKPGKPTFTRTLDAEMQSLLDQRDALRDAADAVLEADPERKDKRKQDLLKVLNKSINEITRKIQDGDFSTKTRKPGEFDKDPDVVKIREARDLLNKTLAAMRKVDPDAAKKQLRDMIAKREAELSKGITLPDTEEDPFAGDEEIQNLRTALDLLSDIKRIKTSTAKIQARLDAKDYTKSVKPTPKTSKAREDAIMEHNRLKSELNRMVIQTELDNRSFGQLVADRTKDLLFNVSRTLKTSADAGTIGRQTQLVAFTRPGVWAKSLPSHFAFAKKHAERVQARVENHPDYDVAVQAGMNLGSWQEGATFEQMNEEMRSEVLRLVPGVGKVAGAVVDASIRAYVSGINSVRMPYFSLLYRTLIGERKGFSAKLTNKLGGVGLGTQKEIEYLARHVEVMTGRGNLRSAAKSAEFLAQTLFSPRYWLSRLQIIGHFPVLAADLMTGFKFFPETRAARKVVAMEYARMAIGVAVYYNFLSMVKHLRGWDDDEMYIEEDPRSSDFGKVKIGNTRIDPMAGMLQNIVFVSRTGAWMLRGTEFGREAIDGDKIVGGKLISMRDAVGDPAKIGDTMGGTMLKMIQTKLAPWPSAIFNVAFGEDAVGNKVRVETEILGLYLPLSQVEIYNAMQEHGANPGLIYSATNLLGWGVSTYGPGTKKTTLEQDAFILMGVDQSRYERDDAKKAPGWKIPKSKGLPTF